MGGNNDNKNNNKNNNNNHTKDLEVGESTPLVGTSKEYDPENEPPPLGNMKDSSLKEKLVSAGALVGLTTSVAAMALESNPVVYVSGAIGSIVAPMAAMQQSKLTQVVALQETNQRMSEEVSQLQDENIRLSQQVSSLESSVVQLQDVSHTLETIRAVEGQSITELEHQLQQSEQILDQMQDNLRGDIIQTLISMVLAIDHDGDMCLSDDEIDVLIVKMEDLNAVGQDNIDFNDALLRQKLIENGRSLNAIMEIIKNLLDENTKPEDNIFSFVNKKK